MTDENQPDTGAAEPEEGAKRLSLKGLKSEMDAQSEATNERLDQLDEGINDISAKFDSMMDMLAGMSAKSRGTGTPNRLETEELPQDPGGEMQFKEGPQVYAPELELVGETRDLAEPAMLEKAEKMKFDQDILKICFSEPAEEQADPICSFSVNGVSYMFRRDPQFTYDVPRCVVEVIAQAKPNSFDNVEYVNEQGVQRVKYPRRMGIRYPFNVLYDPAGERGGRWLAEVLARRQ